MQRQDWPAAHSMDTAWYAVDADGHIGRFETGEAGALPHGAANETEGAFNVGGLHLAARRVTGASAEHGDPPTGVFLYESRDFGVPGAYTRSRAPEKTVKFEDLDPETQAAVGAVRLGAKFADAVELQLADHLDEEEVFSWDDVPLRGEPDDVDSDEDA